jgi:peptide chain release factor 1
MPNGIVFSLSVEYESSGIILLKACGKNAFALFKKETGGHRWQRIPPTEKRGKYQTSTITVAVFNSMPQNQIHIKEEDVSWEYCRGRGKGGQRKNKKDTAVRLTHKATGIQVWCEDERSQAQNKRKALEKIHVILEKDLNSKTQNTQNDKRKDQIGNGERGDKVRTIRVRDNVVVNHANNKRIKYTKYLQGHIEGL